MNKPHITPQTKAHTKPHAQQDADQAIGDRDDSDSEILPPSKSARKREMTALQKLGETLMALPADQLAQVPLSKGLREAFELAKNLKQREAKRRQLQFIGKLMRAENHAEISAAMTRMDDDNRLFRQRFQQLEKIRDELIDNESALEALLDGHPELDRQHLRQLIRQARKHAYSKDQAPEKASVKSRKLFEYLRETLVLA
jgi:ribosome-associated protein